MMREPITLKVSRGQLRDWLDEQEASAAQLFARFGDDLVAALDEAQAEAGDGLARTIEIVILPARKREPADPSRRSSEGAQADG